MIDRAIFHSLPCGKGVKAFFTSRGAIGQPMTPYDGFNVCHYTGDAPEHVEACLNELRAFTGIDRMVIPTQTHSANVRIVEDDTPDLEGVDALVTALPGVVIGVNTADCLPVVMADRVAGVIGVAHAGWRGAIAGIAVCSLEAMVSLGAQRDRVEVCFGPRICLKCFEVGEDVAGRFAPEAVVRRPEWPRPHIDLVKAVARQLMEAGVPLENINMQAECTRHNPHKFFSARAEGVKSGRVFTFAWIEKN